MLAAIGLSESEIKSSIRFGIGRFTTVEEIDFAIGHFADAVTRLRRGEAA